MQLGVIADDFTGATDIASFLVRNGMPTVQLNGVPTRDLPLTSEAVVISLKTRSCPAEMAVSQSLAALRWLQAQGCQQFYFKYCSTFDSTAQGNIGPVLDALLAELGETRTVISPALPVNGRTVYQGYLFVGEQLLNESGMRHHPVTPMEDAHLGRLIERQGRGKAALIAWPIVARGPEAVAAALAAVNDPAVRYVVLDALSEQDLLTQGVALREMKLVSGGSGLAIGLARDLAQRHGARGESAQAGMPLVGPAVVLSGSCSVMTNSQVAAYRQQAPARAVDLSACFTDLESYVRTLTDWVDAQRDAPLAPMIYATTEPQTLQRIQAQYGDKASSERVEQLFAALAAALKAKGFTRFIVAGGETSSIVAQTLGVEAFHIGPTISPGVPWVRDTQAQRLSVVTLQGEWISGDKPSKEVTFHRAVYLHNPACKAIVHLHSHYLTALSCLQGLDPHNCIRPFTPYVVMRVGDVPVVPYYRPGDDRIAQALAGLAPRYNAFLLANHGPVVTGSSLREATNNTEELEETARLIFTLGNREIRYLTADEVKELR
ncbi:3-oxo-tetronate kinase [Klebsiella pneumoniae]|nr:3-oxo-tetronate kinase [Klebsiella pneumoniae]MXM80498.1 aldolase [Klebsiella pneumoniae]